MERIQVSTVKNQYLVRKVSMTDTFRQIPKGTKVLYEAKEAGLFGTALVAVHRLNKSEGLWKIESPDNGATFYVTRVK